MTRTRSLIPASLLAAVLFVPLFIFRSLGPIDFWWWLSFNLIFLIGLSVFSDRSFLGLIFSDSKSKAGRKACLGVLAALALYGIFYAGNGLARQLIPWAGRDIGQVYAFRAGASIPRIVFLMIFLVGPGEEIFWRGFLQRHWQGRLGSFPGWLLTSGLYALVHAGSRNVILVLAAAVCGLFWGFLYLRYRSILLVTVSHTLWDLFVFVVIPFS